MNCYTKVGNNIIVNIRILQLDPAHPFTHVHILGEEHSLLVRHDGLQIAFIKI